MRKTVIVGIIVALAALLGTDWWFRPYLPGWDVMACLARPELPRDWSRVSWGFGVGLRDVAQLLISVGIMAPAVFVVLSDGYKPGDKHWAYGTIGTLLGFWLRT